MTSFANRSYMDSFEKIVDVYFQAVTRQDFTYKGKTYAPKSLRLSPTIFRGFKCYQFCGACCRSFSLEYLPQEKHPYELKARQVELNGESFTIEHDDQADNTNHHCKNVDMETGWCKIHEARPLSCDFELLRFMMPHAANDPEGTKNVNLGHQPFGRSWNMKRIDGSRGVKCEFLPPDAKEIPDIVRKLNRLKDWTDHFKLETCLPIVIRWVETGPHQHPLVIPKDIATCEQMDEFIESSKKKVIVTSTKPRIDKYQPPGFFR